MDWKYRAVISSSIGLSTKHHITNFEKIKKKQKIFKKQKNFYFACILSRLMLL